MKVLFTHSYFLTFDPKQHQTATPYPPLGTLYAAALLRTHGFEVKLEDIQFAQSPEVIQSTLRSWKPEVLVIYDDGFNYLTKMCLTNMREAAFRMQALAKVQDCQVIVSSSDATDHYDKYLDQGADVVLLGEAEYTLLELCQQLNTGNYNPEQISGLVYRKEGQSIKTVARPVLKDLDQLPLPAWDLVDLKPYKEMWLKHHGYFSLNMVTTRGCPYKCNWCAKPIYGNRYNSHAPENIVAQIQRLQKETGFSHIWFCDDIFGLKPGWLKTFTNLIKEKGLKIQYKIQSRADLLLEEDTVSYLAQSGCSSVWMGAESGSQKILDAMDKGITVTQIYQATQLLKKHHIQPAFFLQFGYPGEQMNDIQATLKMIRELLPEDIGISVSYPLPGTKFYEQVKHELKTKTNWEDSDDLHLMFKNTYPAAFYKRLHSYTHRTYRSSQSLHYWKASLSGKGKINKNTLKRMFALPYYTVGAGLDKLRLKRFLNA